MTTGCRTAGRGFPMQRLVLPTALFVLVAAACSAATLRVARDGSADFASLQEAIAAAASGDVISMAPGIYDQVFTLQGAGGTFQTYGGVQQAVLTIIGDDAETVIIGPTAAPANLQTSPNGIVTDLGVDLTVQGVTVRYTSNGVLSDGSRLSVTDCKFLGNYNGIDSAAQFGTDVVDCEFMDSTDLALFLAIPLGGTNAWISHCTFANNFSGIHSQMVGTVVSECTVTGGVSGIVCSASGTSMLTNCAVRGQSNVSLSVGQGATFQLFNNVVENTPVCLNASGAVSGSGNLFAGGSAATIVTSRAAFYDFHENHILNAGGWTIWGQIGGTLSVVTHDFSNNFWGTSDANQIRTWIFDNTDDSRIRWIADFEPFHTQPIATEAMSFGELRALFGGE